MQIDAVIFDIGRVLIEWNPERMFDGKIGEGRRKALFADVPLATMNDCVDLGAPFRQSVEALARAYPSRAAEIRLWHDHWLEMASPAIGHSVRLLTGLRAKGVAVYALTNFGIETFETARAAYPFLTEFDRAFVSGHMRLMKPDPAIYQAVEAALALPPERLFFTDDKPDNTAAASDRGWQTHLFETPGGLAARLVAEGLLSPEEAE